MKILYLFKKNVQIYTNSATRAGEAVVFIPLLQDRNKNIWVIPDMPSHRVSKIEMLQKSASFLQSMILIHFFLSRLPHTMTPNCFL